MLRKIAKYRLFNDCLMTRVLLHNILRHRRVILFLRFKTLTSHPGRKG